VIRWSALVSGCCAGAILIDLCLIKGGFEKAFEMLEKGVFVGAPRLKVWRKDTDYMFWGGRCGERRGKNGYLHQLLTGKAQYIVHYFI